MSTPNNSSWKGSHRPEKLIANWCLVEPLSYQMVESAASMNSIKCPIQLAPSSMKSWNNKQSPSPKQASSPLSTPEPVSSPLPTQSAQNIIPTCPSHKTLIFHPHCSRDSILCTSFSIKLTRLRIGDWRRILWGCTWKIVLNMLHPRMLLYFLPPEFWDEELIYLAY
jgi:hypothetical protein